MKKKSNGVPLDSSGNYPVLLRTSTWISVIQLSWSLRKKKTDSVCDDENSWQKVTRKQLQLVQKDRAFIYIYICMYKKWRQEQDEEKARG